MKKFLTCALALVLAFSMILPLASCKGNNPAGTETGTGTGTGTAETTPERELVKFTGNFTYNDSVSVLATNWNPHVYEDSDNSYPLDYITTGLYSFYFNDALHPVEGKEAFDGYVILPEMAASEPVDVTETIKALEGNPYGIPESATSGYAYTIDLNPAAKWQDGTPINADTYVYSMKQLLDPDLMNYRSTDYMDQDLSIANADKYFYQGRTQYLDNGITNGYTLADLTKGADGVYTTPDGNKMYIAIANIGLDWLGGDTLFDYVEAYGDKYFGMEKWEEIKALVNADGVIPLTDENNALLASVTTTNPAWGETEEALPNYWVEALYFEDNYAYDGNVGLFKSGDYQITLVLSKSLSGFYLLYNLSSNWIVYESLYESCKQKIEGTDAWTSTYNTSVETTMSYGPYKLTNYQADMSMKFERNENWFGYTDGKHVYVDPQDDKLYPMFQTTAVYCRQVAEADTRLLMFKQGQLMTYGLQASDYDTYKTSDYCYASPGDTVFFFIFNGYTDAINNREANEGFDQTKYDLQTMTLKSFRQAIAVTYDKEAMSQSVSPSRTGAYGLIGGTYIYDPETCAYYRDTDQAKKALCDFYSVDVSKYASLDEAVDSITGYDPEAAKALFTQAFNEALEKGYITDNDKDGKSDQAIQIEYAASTVNAFIEQTLDYLNGKLKEVLVGTPFEGKVEFVASAPLGDQWVDNIRNGLSDTVLAGWTGSAMNPFSLTDLYVNPVRAYDANWFNASSISKTINVTVNGEKKDVTMTLTQWSDALNGSTVTVDGVEYCFGDGVADLETRVDILAALESTILQTYDYIPMLQDGSKFLLSKQVFYVVEDYNPVLGRGGITYMRYNYDDTAWATYVSEQGGELKY